ncbi:hypothetical protein CONLIGDRAFT_95275 [Coniochaeta ligniaria NRRL 30616]|uniref:Uncharacterized protein n=1 Tax=Coniochaeta ligniaria NRRL 30616 TaxID=1408157 RepID=A0A1J7I389_9PEZI|nr:hypothetical protein CONLIGDRAFT_95275 [Coniochaeta ligniaria NRRL 30616]
MDDINLMTRIWLTSTRALLLCPLLLQLWPEAMMKLCLLTKSCLSLLRTMTLWILIIWSIMRYNRRKIMMVVLIVWMLLLDLMLLPPELMLLLEPVLLRETMPFVRRMSLMELMLVGVAELVLLYVHYNGPGCAESRAQVREVELQGYGGVVQLLDRHHFARQPVQEKMGDFAAFHRPLASSVDRLWKVVFPD